MEQFQSVVVKLLNAFTCGVKLVKVQSSHVSGDQHTSRNDPNIQLRRSLRQNRAKVQQAYQQNIAKHNDFVLDTEAHSSLTAILFRLNAGFVSIISRFNRGHTTPSDHQALLHLCTSSRKEAIFTFDQLSARLSSPMLSLASTRPLEQKHRKKKNKQARSVQERERAALAALGWIRPKAKSSSSSSRSAKSKHIAKGNLLSACTNVPAPIGNSSTRKSYAESRRSAMTFASDSTKLGEISDRQRVRGQSQETSPFLLKAIYPVELYKPPEKRPSRLRRLFGRG